MIQSVSDFKANNSVNRMAKPQRNSTYMNANNIFNSANKSQNGTSKIAFKGQQFPSGYYEDDEITDAKRFLHEIGDKWKEKLRAEKISQFKAKSDEAPFLAKLFAIFFAGGPIQAMALDSGMRESAANQYVERVAKLIPDLKKATRRVI